MVIVTNEPYSDTEPMLTPVGGAATLSIKQLRDADGEAHQNPTSATNAEISIQDPALACKLLSTAVTLNNAHLVKQCVYILDKKMEPSNVLTVYAHLSKCLAAADDNHAPSAPPDTPTHNNSQTELLAELTANLREKCLSEIDEHADSILRQAGIGELAYADLLAITTRDTLQVASEVAVYMAVVRWAHEECRRRALTPHVVNVRTVVRQLRFAPRYGLMSKKEFGARWVHQTERGPTKSGLLEEHEWRKIKFHIKERAKGRHVDDLPMGMSRPRRAFGGEGRRVSDECSRMTVGDKLLMNFLTCWAAVFD